MDATTAQRLLDETPDTPLTGSEFVTLSFALDLDVMRTDDHAVTHRDVERIRQYALALLAGENVTPELLIDAAAGTLSR